MIKKHIIRIRKTVFFFVILPVLIVDIVSVGLYFYPHNGQNKLTQIILSIETWYNQQVEKRVEAQILPKEGFQTKIILGNSIPKLISYGVIDKTKVENLYKTRGGLTKEQKKLLNKSSNQPLIITAQNATWLVNILWEI